MFYWATLIRVGGGLATLIGLCLVGRVAAEPAPAGVENSTAIQVEWTAQNGAVGRRSGSGLPSPDRTEETRAASEAPFSPADWVVERRTADAVVWRHRRIPGLHRAEISSQPMVPAAGRVAAVPRADGRGGYGYRSGPVAIRMPRDLGQPIRMSFGGRRLAVRLVGMAFDGAAPHALPQRSRPRRAGAMLTYPHVFPGVTAEYEMFSWGLKSFYVLDSRPELRGETLDFVEEIDMPGIELRIAGRPVTAPVATRESIAFVDPATGRTLFSLPPPFAADAGRGRTPVVQQIERVGSIVRIRYRTPTAWLADPRRVYPVRIDPSPETITASYSKVLYGAGSTFTWDDGYISSGYFQSEAYRTGIDFTTTIIPDSSIVTNVQLRLTIDDEKGTLNNDVGRMTNSALSYFNANNQSGFWADVDGNEYLSNSSAFAGKTTHTVALLAAARTDLQCQLSANWFSVGFTGTTESGGDIYRDGKAYNESNPPAIIVTYTAATPTLSASMTSQPTYDPVRGTTNPLYIPLGYALQTATVSNSGQGDADANSTRVTVPVPSQSTLYVGNLGGAGSGPVSFTDGAVSSALTYTFTSLSSTTDGIEFSNNSGSSWTYVPTPDANGFDAAVTHFRVTPTGTFRGTRCASGTTSFSIGYRTRTK